MTGRRLADEHAAGEPDVASVVLDPELEASLAKAPPQVRLTAENLAAARRHRNALYAQLARTDAVERTDHVIRDEPLLKVRVHRPTGVTGPLPCAFSIHGGGYVMGSYEWDDLRFEDLAVGVPCIGVSVDHRLAPETPFPGPLDDCHDALRWTYDHADELGIDAARIGVIGSSAGGGLAAALALLARDRGEVPLAFQVLECPMLDDRQITRSSRLDDLPIWSREENELGWRSYLGELYGGDVPPYAAPARCDDLAGLPPALVIVGTADGFHDEDVDYASRLSRARVLTDLHVLAGVPHGIAAFARSGARRRWADLVRGWLIRHVAP